MVQVSIVGPEFERLVEMDRVPIAGEAIFPPEGLMEVDQVIWVIRGDNGSRAHPTVYCK